jgi:hypothetical protein
VLSVVFLVARYAEVTAPALYGRPVNLYWDAAARRQRRAHAGRGRRARTHALVVAGALLAVVLAFVLFRAAWARIAAGLERPAERARSPGWPRSRRAPG